MKAPPPGFIGVIFLLFLTPQTIEGGCDVDELPDKPAHGKMLGAPEDGEADVGTEVTYKCKTGYEFIGDPVPYVTERPTTAAPAACE